MAKRAFDFLVALLVLILTSPIWLIASALIVLGDRGSVFYKQKRVGRNGSVFEIYKFRTMRPDADKIGGFATADGDVRITPIGRYLRRTSVDELPQLINVLIGDMSLVGPRPDVPAQRYLYDDAEFTKRHAVRPGITGLAQATLRSTATAEQRKQLDLQYVDQSSLLFDLKIIILTVRQLVIRGGN